MQLRTSFTISWRVPQGDRLVSLAELRESDGGYDCAAFAEEYRRSEYPKGK
jgi:hypothetical protein